VIHYYSIAQPPTKKVGSDSSRYRPKLHASLYTIYVCKRPRLLHTNLDRPQHFQSRYHAQKETARRGPREKALPEIKHDILLRAQREAVRRMLPMAHKPYYYPNDLTPLPRTISLRHLFNTRPIAIVFLRRASLNVPPSRLLRIPDILRRYPMHARPEAPVTTRAGSSALQCLEMDASQEPGREGGELV
jgi:hypothetical protein